MQKSIFFSNQFQNFDFSYGELRQAVRLFFSLFWIIFLHCSLLFSLYQNFSFPWNRSYIVTWTLLTEPKRRSFWVKELKWNKRKYEDLLKHFYFNFRNNKEPIRLYKSSRGYYELTWDTVWTPSYQLEPLKALSGTVLLEGRRKDM